MEANKTAPSWTYVINGFVWPKKHPLGVPKSLLPTSFGEIRLDKVAIKLPGENDLRFTHNRFLVTIRNGEADDEQAHRLAEAMMATLNLMLGGLYFIEPTVFRIPSEHVSAGLLELESIVEHGELIGPDDGLFALGWEMGVQNIVIQAVGLGEDVLAQMVEWLPITMHDPFFKAATYYQASLRELAFVGGDRDLVLARHPQTPSSSAEAAKAENALHNAFKVIETLIGEPHSDDRKFQASLSALGVDSSILAGWPLEPDHPQLPLWQKIRLLHSNRDKRAAHARTGPRPPLTYYEIMDAQGCAETVLQMAVLAAQRLNSANHGTSGP